MVTVRHCRIDARRVFNLTAPRWLPQVSATWKGVHPWHDARNDFVRVLLENTYIRLFNEATGHYRLLEESIRANGIWNPVMLTTGPLYSRGDWELPPEVQPDPERIVCEYVGGSRLLIAARLGLDVPAIINDRANLFPDAEEIHRGGLAHVFVDRPRKIEWREDGSVFANFFDYGHFPARERDKRRREQRELRRGIVERCVATVEKWRLENDR